MTVLAAFISRSSYLALDIYQLNTTSSNTRKAYIGIAKSITSLALAVKQIGTILKDNDQLPSRNAIEELEDILDQSNTILGEIELTVNDRDVYENVSTPVERLQYLSAHMDALRTTLSVMLQTLHTIQIIIWGWTRPAVSPQKVAKAVANEKSQLETLIIEQQISILNASKVYQLCRTQSESRLLMEHDSSQSLVPLVSDNGPQPAHLTRYQNKFITSLETSESAEEAWVPAVCSITKPQLERLLETWTCLHQVEYTLKELEKSRRHSLQPTVESDSESEDEAHLGSHGVKIAAPIPRLPNGLQPLFTETTTLPIPVSQPKVGPTAPLSPASSYGVSPRSSGSSIPIPSSISTAPVEAAAAIEAQQEDEDVQLEIPWALRTRKHYWKYIDSKVVESSCDLSPSFAFSERNCWTEILASWVCKEAIREAGFRCTQVQKERRDGRRTKLDTCFCIEQRLTFDQVHQLVERTVQIFRQRQPPSPAPASPRPKYELPLKEISKGTPQDRDRTPVAKSHPPLERSTTSFLFPPPPPPLDRSVSMPHSVPKYPPQPRIIAEHPLMSQPYSPQTAPHSPQTTGYFPQMYPQFTPHPHLSPHPTHQVPVGAYPIPLSPLRQSSRYDLNTTFNATPSSNPACPSDLSASGTSDSDSVARSRKQRSRSQNRSSPSRSNKKKGYGHNSGTLGALVGVGGLTALLDGLSAL